MPTEQLRYELTAVDRGVAKTLSGIHVGLGALSAAVPAALGPLVEIMDQADRIGEHFEKSEHRVQRALTGIGAVGVGVGLALQGLASQEQASAGNLKNAIENLGGAWSDYKDRIDETIKSGEHFGQTAATTQNVLATLTQATNDPALALKYYNTVLDLSASKHMSAIDAAALLARAYNGSAKALRQFGLEHLKGVDALDALSAKLKGDASAAADTFTGHVKSVGAAVDDAASSFGAKFGPAITAVSGGMIAVSAGIGATNKVLDIFKARNEAAAIAAAEAAAAVEAEGVAAETSGAQIGRGARLMSGALSGLKGGLITAGIGVGIAAIGEIAAHVFGDNSIKNVTDFTAAIEADSGALGVNTEALSRNMLAHAGVLDTADKLGLSIQDVTKASIGDTDAMARLRTEAEKHTETFRGVTRISDDYQRILNTVAASAKKAAADQHTYALATKDVDRKASDVSVSMGRAGSAAIGMADGMRGLEPQLKAAADAAQAVTDRINGMNTALRDASGQELGLSIAKGDVYAAGRDFRASLKQNGSSMDPTTAKGLANLQAKERVDQAVQAYGQALTGSNLNLDEQKRRLQEAAGAAASYGVSIGKIPTVWKTKLQIEDEAASRAIRAFKAQLKGIPDQVVNVILKEHMSGANTTEVAAAAAGAAQRAAAGNATHSNTTTNNITVNSPTAAETAAQIARQLRLMTLAGIG